MDYYENVVSEYLRADRSIFLNTQCCIQLNEAENPDTSGPHWYCDAVALDFQSNTIFLCEISYADKLSGLIHRLKSWAENWSGLRLALRRDCHIATLDGWEIRPWLFVPETTIPHLISRLDQINGENGEPVFTPKITPLESVQPWKYRSWNHRDKPDGKPVDIPESMRE